MKSWKSTSLGILTIISAISGAAVSYLKTGALPDFSILIAAVTAGIGLLTTRDHSVSSEQAGIK